MSILGKRVRIGKYGIPVLLLLTIAVTTVVAVAYVILTWTMSLTVSATPRVHFWDGASAANTMDITMNIFPNARTIDENNDDWDIESVTAGNIYIRVDSMDTSDVAELRIKAFVGAVDLFDLTWTDADAEGTFHGPYATDDATIYDLWIEVLAAGTATDPASIALELKVESP